MKANNHNNIPYHFYMKDKCFSGEMFFFQKLYHIFLFLILCTIAGACIEEFHPKLSESTELLVIEGTVIKGDSIQKVFISRSSPLNDIGFEPEIGCAVWVTNLQGQTFEFEEKLDGKYEAVIPEEYLEYNIEFKLNVISPDGNEYESDYDVILESSPIDSLYYYIETFQSSALSSEMGVQFYTDLKAEYSASKNYRWILEETWEVHTEYVGNWIWSRGPKPFARPPDTICYNTKTASDIYTASTVNLMVNEKKKIPLRYFPETSYKINYNYSALVKQFALSDMAYEYWDKNKVQTSESGGLYQTQPSMSRSNICNINDPNEVVLGFFWTSSYSEKRINFKGPLDGVYHLAHGCGLYVIDPLDLPMHHPIYIVNENGVWMYADQMCFDCTIVDGIATKPDFFE